MIEVKNLTKKYGEQMAIDHLNFTIEDGRIYGFLGPNGAGKTTTMNIMTGCLAATEGSVTIDSLDIFKDAQEAKKRIGYLPEQPPLYLEMTIDEYLQFIAEAKGVEKELQKGAITAVAEKTDLWSVRNRLLNNLSKGYRQRVGIAQALLGNPQTIIMDEPTIGLDPRQMMEIRSLIRELGKEHTVFISSHILSEIKEVSDHIMIISQGRLVASDTPENLEHLISGKAKMRLLVKASREEAEHLLQLLGEEIKYNIVKGNVGEVLVSLSYPNSIDISERIFTLFSKANKPILEMYKEKTNLEDVFLELTEESSEADEEAAADESDL